MISLGSSQTANDCEGCEDPSRFTENRRSFSKGTLQARNKISLGLFLIKKAFPEFRFCTETEMILGKHFSVAIIL
ncbi:hypothetical protein DVW06_10780 [Enterococcus sp. ARL09-542]|nr:hypothetical protein HSIEG1_582 [Enterococcus sp. HSIEG1]KIL81373.1 hypothetical protein EH68_09625 [Enterococcus gallinarum]TKL05250.1 hypothetical protein DVW06_10780 [Enterococcus sp. ARL09-542]PCD95559.1 hypothetical protein CKY18_05750 [Enterococcus gallinarum]RGC48173.1 hypothetical protein DXA88_04305 [Enterococcus gallinarum]